MTFLFDDVEPIVHTSIVEKIQNQFAQWVCKTFRAHRGEHRKKLDDYLTVYECDWCGRSLYIGTIKMSFKIKRNP